VNRLVENHTFIKNKRDQALIHGLNELFHFHPRAVSLWLAYHIHEVYDAPTGSLFPRLLEALKFNIPNGHREEFVVAISNGVKRATGVDWSEVIRHEAEHQALQKNVETLLALTGIAKTQAEPLARWIFRSWKNHNLPDPADPEAGRLLQANLLRDSRSVPIRLRRAIARRTGAFLCQQSLYSLHEDERALLPPGLAEALYQEFSRDKALVFSC
jgi:hypothetical protein